MMEEELRINGTLISYYYTCKREAWLIYHGIESDQEDDNIAIGNLISKESYPREKKEISIMGSKLDIISSGDKGLVISEVKKSSRNMKGSKMQLIYYLKMLKDNGVNTVGELRIPKEKKVIRVELTEEDEISISKATGEIIKLISGKIPDAVSINFCKKCSYSEFCWTD